MKIFCALMLLSSITLAQISDNFNDGNLNKNPKWIGDTNHFTVSGGQLNLSAPSKTDTSILYLPSSIAAETEWKIKIDLDFNPSSSNYVKVILTSETSNLKDPQKGYFVKVGGSEDDVSLYRLDGKNEILLIDGKDNLLNKANSEVSIYVTKDTSYTWQLFADTSGMLNYEFQGSSVDSSYRTSSYFGISCRYTSSRSNKIRFDDVHIVGKTYVDVTPPSITQHNIEDAFSWKVSFSEALDTSSIDIFKLRGSNPLNNISDLNYDSSNRSLTIKYSKAFKHGVMYQLELDSLFDLSGNILKQRILFDFFNHPDSISYKDIVINELMPDPEPRVSLPESEYIEILNNSPIYLNLASFYITDKKDTAYFSDKTMSPGQYILLADRSDSSLWLEIDVTKAFINLPSLNNSGDHFYLYSRDLLIDSISYTSNQFNNSSGGRSIELVDPNYYCSDTSNWKLCNNALGGSPGAKNSNYDVHGKSEVIEFERFLSVEDSSTQFRLSSNFLSIEDIDFNPYVPIKNINWDVENNITINTYEVLLKDVQYGIEIIGLKNCYFHYSDTLHVNLVYPSSANEGELIFNEFLFNPHIGGSDFIELYNNSNRSLDLSQYFILNTQMDSSSIIKPLTPSYRLIEPNQYLVLTDDTSDILNRYPPGKKINIIQYDLPSMPDSKGRIYLYKDSNQILDFLNYNESYHFPLLENKEGVSLERISFLNKTTAANNWTSASSVSNYATPGLKNSQHISSSYEYFKITPSIFSPDNDGYQDVLAIHYSFNKSNVWGSITIYNSEGKLIRKLVQNDLFGTRGDYFWDGLDKDQNRLPLGYYIIIFEAWHPDGEIIQEKKSVVIANLFK